VHTQIDKESSVKCNVDGGTHGVYVAVNANFLQNVNNQTCYK
jgi:hypothetical protein